MESNDEPMSQLKALGVQYDIIAQPASGKHGVRIWIDDTRAASSELCDDLNTAIKQAIEKYQRMKAVNDGQ